MEDNNDVEGETGVVENSADDVNHNPTDLLLDSSNSMFLVRSSKFRHVYGVASRKENSYEGIRITKDAHDSSFCCVNPKFIAVVLESAGGGVFMVLPIEQTGRAVTNASKVCGHRGPVTDIKWHPFNDNVIASGSDDTTIKVWKIPDGGLIGNLNQWLVSLQGHSKKISYIEWHPAADGILLSAAADFKCIVWNVSSGQKVHVISVHSDTIFSISWNRNGSLFATTCKDKQIRVIDPRAGNVVAQGTGHLGPKASKVVFLDQKRLFTTGFSRMSERQFALWNMEDLSKPLRSEDVDASSGILIPYFDYDTKVMFLAGKGDGNIRFFEIVDEAPYVFYLSQYQSGSPQRGLGVMPKRGLDTSKCEIVRFYKLHTLKDMCEPISMIVPRKSEQFQDDIYPLTNAPSPALSAEEWLQGQDRDPILFSLESVMTKPGDKKTTKRELMDTINSTAYHEQVAVSGSSAVLSSNCAREKLTESSCTAQQSVTLRQHVSHGMERIPASLKNIHRLSSAENQPVATNENWQRRIEIRKNPVACVVGTDSAQHTVDTVGGMPSAGTNASRVNTDSSVPADESELRKAFLNQRGEIAELRDQVTARDRRILLLEDEVRRLRALVAQSNQTIPVHNIISIS